MASGPVPDQPAPGCAIAPFVSSLSDCSPVPAAVPRVLMCNERIWNYKLRYACHYCLQRGARAFWRRSKFFNTLNEFAGHCSKFHSEESRPFSCHRCAESFETASDYERHRVRQPSFGYWCQLCDLVVAEHHRMLLHARSNHKDAFDKTKQLPTRVVKRPRNRKDLEIVKSYPSFSNPLRCPECGKISTTRFAARSHRMRQHYSINVKINYCPVCGAKFKSRTAGLAHHCPGQKGVGDVENDDTTDSSSAETVPDQDSTGSKKQDRFDEKHTACDAEGAGGKSVLYREYEVKCEEQELGVPSVVRFA